MDRPILEQNFFPYHLLVGTRPTQLNLANQQADLSMMIQSFIICVPAASPRNVVLGDQGVSITSATVFNGLEIRAGIPIRFVINQTRQLYEIETPLIESFCVSPARIPVIAWNPSNIFLVATAATDISVILFPNVYV